MPTAPTIEAGPYKGGSEYVKALEAPISHTQQFDYQFAHGLTRPGIQYSLPPAAGVAHGLVITFRQALFRVGSLFGIEGCDDRPQMLRPRFTITAQGFSA
jgi:hypothetical protein